MALIDAHLEQISLSAVAISELPFPPPKIFTNALLHQHDITALIRDTEAHERALFSVPPAQAPVAQESSSTSSRRKTVYPSNNADLVVGNGGTSTIRAPRRNTAVAAVLGGDLVEQIRKGGGGGPGTGLGYSGLQPRERGEVDVEILLKGAEKLCAVYPIEGAAEQIASLRARYAQLSSSVAHHEARVATQETRLERKNRPQHSDEEVDDEVDSDLEITEDDVKREEEEIKELEKKKKGLEDRVAGMERDLGGLLR